MNNMEFQMPKSLDDAKSFLYANPEYRLEESQLSKMRVVNPNNIYEDFPTDKDMVKIPHYGVLVGVFIEGQQPGDLFEIHGANVKISFPIDSSSSFFYPLQDNFLDIRYVVYQQLTITINGQPPNKAYFLYKGGNLPHLSLFMKIATKSDYFNSLVLYENGGLSMTKDYDPIHIKPYLIESLI